MRAFCLEILAVPSLFDSVTASYSVRTLADPNVVERLLGYFAAQNLIPQSVRVRRFGDTMTVAIDQPEVDEHRAAVIAAKMRSVVAVESVMFECSIGMKQRAA